MFCPQCGQRRAANEVRFCSSCGLPLGVVSEVLANAGQLPARTAAPEGPRELTPRQKGIRQGAMMMFSTMLVVPLVVFVSVFITTRAEFLIPTTAVILFVGGLLRIFYALLFEENAPQAAAPPAHACVPPAVPPDYLGAGERGAALPPAQGTPARAYRPARLDTGELAAPPSVTDHTTRLLGQRGEEPPQR